MCLMTSCDKDKVLNTRMVFIGDSLVAGWDLKYYFPSRLVKNDALIGSGVNHLESRRGTCTGLIAVVLSGTNDLGIIPLDEEQDYIERYMTAVKQLGARHTYLFCILPRDDSWSREEPRIYNTRIKSFNEKIKALCDNLPDITYVDVFDQMLYKGALNPDYTYDGLHLSPVGYEVISSKLQEYI